VPAGGRPGDPPGHRGGSGGGVLMDMIVPTDPCYPLAAEAPAVRAEGVNFSYGEGEARFQVLFDNRIDIAPGQLVVMTGPSGSGKTTLLTLIGGLRSLQEGRIEVLGHDLSGLGPRELVRVRRDIGFIFQLHNLFESLTAYENVKMAVQLAGVGSAAHIRERAVGILERLGLGHRSGSGWRSRGPSPTGRSWFSPTSRPPRSTRMRATLSSNCSRK
jgi:putative ABC transport system ATP-binding protein